MGDSIWDLKTQFGAIFRQYKVLRKFVFNKTLLPLVSHRKLMLRIVRNLPKANFINI